MRLGKLLHRMTVEQLAGRRNEHREIVEEHAPAFEIYASLEPLSQSERDKAAAVGRITTHRITCHYHPDIDGSCRLRLGERVFNIVDIINVGEMSREYSITASEVQDGA